MMQEVHALIGKVIIMEEQSVCHMKFQYAVSAVIITGAETVLIVRVHGMMKGIVN